MEEQFLKFLGSLSRAMGSTVYCYDFTPDLAFIKFRWKITADDLKDIKLLAGSLLPSHRIYSSNQRMAVKAVPR